MFDQSSRPQPPVADRRPHPRRHHGDVFDDPYEWLRDKANPEVIELLNAENAYADAMTAHLEGLRQELFDDIKVRTQETDLSVPSFTRHRGGDAWWYYSRTVEGSAYQLYCRAPATDRDHAPQLGEAEIPGEQVLLDANLESQGHEFFSLGALTVSPDGTLLAFSVDNSGDERYDLWVRRLDLQQIGDGGHPDALGASHPGGPVVTDIAHGATWAGQQHLFYQRVDEAWRPHQVWLHTLGSDPSSDVLVFEETDERYWVGVDASRDENWIIIHNGSKLTSEAFLLPAAQPTAKPVRVAEKVEGVEYGVEVGDGVLYLLHNQNSPDFEVSSCPLVWDESAAELAPRHRWTSVAAPAEGVRYTAVEAYRDFVVVSRRRDGIAGVQVHRGDGVTDLEFPEQVYDAQTTGSEDIDTDRFQLTYTSLVTPTTVHDYLVDRGELVQLKQTQVRDHPVRGAYRPEDHVSERQWARATDGTLIPLSIVRRRDTPLDGTAPCLLYGYGSYEISIPPAFAVSRLSLLDRGFVFVIAHIRGGGEMGRAWYENGKTLTKKNTFTDFVDSAKWLVDNGYTSSDRLVAEGRSAGGLLMGAIANLAPDLFAGVHAGVAFVDALTTILDPSLPLTVTEWEEWGDPLHDPEVYAYMRGYSPYENIAPVQYPAILATTGLNDTRVYYVEPTKWVQQLRHTIPKKLARPVLQKTEMVAGHAGVTGRYDQWKERAWELAWIIDVAGQHPGHD
ncbi:S9 family peptidase [Aestuariimicrobium kwangyangense]|uniref:S9 family peptidase n=1 Tax=Aestuariimicrobium kwangyangense TaxID=396389 RepID=UPI0003B52328|nr:S9 family peptidase [Aestuariimicrobium kwangyangense]